MKEKLFKGAANIVTFLFMAIFMLGFNSCGNDDEEDNDGNSGNNPLVQALVGTWTRSTQDQVGLHTITLTFNSNGTGTHQYFDVDEKKYLTDRFNWKLNGDYLTLSIVSYGGDSKYSFLNQTTPFPVDGDDMYIGGYWYKRK